jgi:hypothetical protein
MGIHILFDRRQVMWCSMFSISDVKGAVGRGLCYELWEEDCVMQHKQKFQIMR